MFNSVGPTLNPPLKFTLKFALAILCFPRTGFDLSKKKWTAATCLAISKLLPPGSAPQHKCLLDRSMILVQDCLFGLQVFLQMCTVGLISSGWFVSTEDAKDMCPSVNLKVGNSLSVAWMEVHVQQRLFSDLLTFLFIGNIFLCSRKHSLVSRPQKKTCQQTCPCM